MEARRLAADILQRRVQELVDNAIPDTTLDDAGRITLLRGQLQSLPDTPDRATEQAILKQLQAEFPSLPQDCSGPELFSGVLSVFRMGKELLLRSLDDYPKYLQSRSSLSKSQQAKLPTMPLSEWLAKRRTMGITSEDRAQPDLHKR
jgi:hypothetical protein